MMVTPPEFFEALLSGGPMLADGAMGTLLHEHGVRFELCFDELNVSQPSLVAGIHREYIEAGSQLIKTNTFGANYFKLKQHGLETEVDRINKAGVELAQKVVEESSRRVFIAGDIGPLGVRLAPFGRVHPEQARIIFAGQIRALSQAGVDLLLIETMTDLHEIIEAIQAARQVETQLSRPLPVIASVTFTRDDRTLLGDDPAQVARTLQHAGTDLIGVNCSGGPEQLLRILKASASGSSRREIFDHA